MSPHSTASHRSTASLRFVYAIICFFIFAVEVAIARHIIGGNFVRAYIGDLLVIVLIYYFLRGMFLTPALGTAAFAVLFGFIVEGLQFFHVATLLGLKEGQVLYIVIGNTFQVGDLFMYIIGGTLALLLDVSLLSPRYQASAK